MVRIIDDEREDESGAVVQTYHWECANPDCAEYGVRPGAT